MSATHPAELVESVDVRLLANLSDNFRSPYEAILELVDNALASRLPGRPIRVTVTGSGGVGGTLRVVTKGGRGMGLDDLGEFLRWGKAPDAVGLNRYGQGGKAAIGYLGSGMRIRCNRFDQDAAYQIEDHVWLLRPDGQLKRFIPQVATPAIPGEGVVQTEIVNLRCAINLRRLGREVSWRYRPALDAGMLKVTVGRLSVAAADLPVDEQHQISREITVGGRMTTVVGWVGIAPSGFDGKGGMRCSAFGRVVLQHEYFGHRSSSFKASLNSLVGEVDLSLVPVVLNKNAFDTASPEWEAVQSAVYEEMDPVVRRLLRRRDPGEPSDEERLRAMEAHDVAQRALEKIAAEAATRGRGGQLAGRKPPSTRDDSEAAERQASSALDRDRAPKTPPPPDAVGKLARRGLALDWDVRALDSRIRSARAMDNGRTEIVINSQYPLYRRRGGDLAYMIETGLLEQLKPGADQEMTVEEYHDQLGESLYLALSEIGRSGASRKEP